MANDGKPKVSLTGQSVRDRDSVYYDRARSRRRSEVFKLPWLMDERNQWKVLGGFFVFFHIVLTFLISMILIGVISFSPNLFYVWKIGKFGNMFFSLYIFAFFKFGTIFLSMLSSSISYFIMSIYRKRLVAANSSEDLLEYEGDAYLLEVEDLIQRYRVVPDIGAHFKNVLPSMIVSHIVLTNDGIKKRKLPVWEIVDGKRVHKRDENGNLMFEMGDLFDTKAGLKELEVVGMRDKQFLKAYNPKKLYVDSQRKQTLADYINDNFYISPYETEKPKGVYVVDTSPTNSMLVAMTRGNKGQCIINPYIDMLLRGDVLTNAFINDPKGELYSMFFETIKMRKFDTVVFNLLDSKFTDQYNPLSPAVMYARKGYQDEPQKAITVLADNFFPIPTGGGSDPFWTRAEQRLFSALSFLLIDIYIEHENLYLHKYSNIYSQAVISRDLDDMWANVTLANVYRMVSTLGTKMFKQPNIEVTQGIETTILGSEESNMLTVLMQLTGELPTSNTRRLFAGPYGELKSMESSEKMQASIYGLTLTEMSFFTQGPVMDLTNVSPKRSFDLISMSFPRRFAFKFHEPLVEEYGYVGAAVDFELYEDSALTKKLEGRDFEHTTRIDELCWVEMRFKGIIPTDVVYVKLKVRPRGIDRGVVYAEYYARFEKGYLSTPDGRHFSLDSVKNDYQVRDGVLTPCSLKDGQLVMERPTVRLSNGSTVGIFKLTEVSYREKPIFAFSVTPPSSTVYIKIVLMFIHSLFNASVENSYLTKDDGKPILSTMYILDELGNLVYDGAGIKDMTTKLSIGLAQGQQFVMVFQTMQQITDVYGSTADRTIASNTGVNVFLLSNDLDLLESYSKQAGVHHVARKQSRTNTVNMGVFVDTVEEAASYSTGVGEEPLLSVHRLGQMTNGEALVLSSIKRSSNDGSNVRQNPIFNTKETSLPMSYSLHRYGYMQRKHSMLTVPTENSVFGMKDSIPPFEQILERRAKQVAYMPYAKNVYREIHGLTELEYDRKYATDADRIGAELMLIVNRLIDRLEGNVWEIAGGEFDVQAYDRKFEEVFTKEVLNAKDMELDTVSQTAQTALVKKSNGEVGMNETSEDRKSKETQLQLEKELAVYKRMRTGRGNLVAFDDVCMISSDIRISFQPVFKTAFIATLGRDSAQKYRRILEGVSGWRFEGVGKYSGRFFVNAQSASSGGRLFAELRSFENSSDSTVSGSDGVDFGKAQNSRFVQWHFANDLSDSVIFEVLFKKYKDWDLVFGDGFTREFVENLKAQSTMGRTAR